MGMFDDLIPQSPQAKPGMFDDLVPKADKIGGPIAETTRAASENLAQIKQGLGPDRTAQTIEEMKGRPFWDITPQINNVLSFGKGIMAVPGLAASPVTGTARSAIGAPYAAVAQAVDEAAKAKGIAPPNSGANYAEQGRNAADTAMSGIAPKGFSPVGARPILAPLPDAAALKSAGKAVYQDHNIKSIQIPPQDVTNLTAGITNDLTQQGFRPTSQSAPGTFGELSRLSPPEPKGPSFWDRVQAEMNNEPLPEPESIKSVTVDDMRAARRALNKTAGEVDKIGKPTPDAEAARQTISQIDSFLDNVAPELRTANANYSAGKAADTVNYRTIMANRRANKTGSGTNIENTMRQEADKIPNRGLTAQEQALKDQIVNGTFARNSFRRIGKLGYGDGLSLTQQMIATPLTGGLNIPVAVAATGARKLGEALTRGQLNQLSEMIRSRAPLSVNRPMVTPQLTNAQRIAAILAAQQKQLPALSAVMPSYADQNQ